MTNRIVWLGQGASLRDLATSSEAILLIILIVVTDDYGLKPIGATSVLLPVVHCVPAMTVKRELPRSVEMSRELLGLVAVSNEDPISVQSAGVDDCMNLMDKRRTSHTCCN